MKIIVNNKVKFIDPASISKGRGKAQKMVSVITYSQAVAIAEDSASRVFKRSADGEYLVTLTNPGAESEIVDREGNGDFTGEVREGCRVNVKAK